MKDIWTNFLCCFIGWDYNILKECSAVSKKALHRYAGAVMLLMLIWAYIGYNMATRYFNVQNVYGDIVIAFAFAFVVWTVERQIILIIGKHWPIMIFRFLLAFIMAMIGATIIDQDMFYADIKAKKDIEIEHIADSLAIIKETTYSKEMSFRQARLDSLEKQAQILGIELSKSQSVSLLSSQYIGTDTMGVAKYATSRQSVLNPKFKEFERVNELIAETNDSISSLLIKQQKVRDIAYNQAKESIGLLTELELTFSKEVVFKSPVTIIFYFTIFGFFLILELLVVVGKSVSKECDYEVLVQRQQARKIKQIESILPIEKADKDNG